MKVYPIEKILDKLFEKMKISGLSVIDVICIVCRETEFDSVQTKRVLERIIDDNCELELPMNIKYPIKELLQY